MGPRSLEEVLGIVVASLGVVLLVAAVLLSTTSLSGCGPCWPGSCPDASPTATPTSGATPTPTGPTPTPETDCDITRDPTQVDENLWQSESETCPRLLLDPDAPNYDASDLCESGVHSSGGTNTFLFRFSCNASSPWKLVAATAGTVEDDSGGELPAMLLLKDCPSVVGQSEEFVYGRDLEAVLWDQNKSQIGEVVSDWEAACRASDATDQQLVECAEVCAGTKSLRKALAAQGIETTPEVDCYLALYDSFPTHAGATVTDAEGTLGIESVCACQPTPDFADCLAGGTSTDDGCFTDSDELEVSCEEACWTENGTDEGDCELP